MNSMTLLRKFWEMTDGPDMLARVTPVWTLLRGSWDLVIRVINKVTMLIHRGFTEADYYRALNN